MSKYVRLRFTTSNESPIIDPKFPIWCSGYNSNDEAYIILFAESENYQDYIKSLYPDFSKDKITTLEKYDEITYSDRFPKPEWFKN